MKGQTTEKTIKLERIKDLYEESRLAAAEAFSRMEKNRAQYLGSDEIDGGERALTVRNITYELIESEINPDVPVVKTDAECYSEKRDKNAHSIEKLCSAVRERLPFEELNDLDERYTYIYGHSVWYAEWESGDGDGDVKIHCISPECFIGQAGITRVEDMEYCFLRFLTTKGELMRKYGISREDAELCSLEYEYGGASLSDTAEIIVCFYRDEEGEIGKFVFSGDLVLSDIPRYYKRKRRICSVCRCESERCGCKTPNLTTEDVDEEYIESLDVSVPYFVPKRFPIVIRRNTMGEEGFFGGSDCERIRYQQQSINKVESRILQKLLRAGITPIIPEDSTVTLSNAIFGQVIRTRPGENADSYGKLDTTPDISQDIEEADRLYDQAKRILGITDTLQGFDKAVQESGYARQLKLNQAASRLESKRRIKNLAYSDIYRMIFEHYLAFADVPRALTFKDTFGDVKLTEFDRTAFIEPNGDGTYRYVTDYLFSVDLNNGAEYGREALWEKNLKNLESGTLGNPEAPETLLRYWQSQERSHYPYARENVEYFKTIINQK